MIYFSSSVSHPLRAIINGMIPPVNPAEKHGCEMYIFNNILFNFTVFAPPGVEVCQLPSIITDSFSILRYMMLYIKLHATRLLISKTITNYIRGCGRLPP